MKKLRTIPAMLILLVGMIAIQPGCKKIEDTTAEIFVVNAEGSPISGAAVRLFGEASQQQTQLGEIRLDDTKYTDGAGRVFFDYTDFYEAGQSGFAVLSVNITKDRPAPQTALYLESIIKIEEQTNNIETYTLE